MAGCEQDSDRIRTGWEGRMDENPAKGLAVAPGVELADGAVYWLRGPDGELEVGAYLVPGEPPGLWDRTGSPTLDDASDLAGWTVVARIEPPKDPTP